ncbi:sodium:proton antiporter [Sphingomonas sp. AP4-R1]|uniref:cation:proton antiporter n=1 Tax=Sphingomonas sp. AP4-R1 TaxID=2735134 RepID=UPI0014938C24|nr:cation:proton antiporter [Sphingomonas sp. AP4-R1]QJU59185.1 sodium:proton antiporter [Sphingomonas sp. AP4-R1]
MPPLFVWPPEPYILALLGVGLLIALVAWLPLALRNLPLSLPIVCIAIGALLGRYAPTPVVPLPGEYPRFVEHFTEFVVLVALVGAGLKIDRIFGWKRWAVTWRLLGPTMLLTIASVTAIGVGLLGLPLPLALLLGGAMAPTDPVLAAEVQVGPPTSGEDDEVRFGLTSEAGLNDGLAFPFVHLAIALAAAAASGGPWVTEWVLHSVIWETAAGIAIGWIIGWLFGWITFHIPADSKLAQTGDGVIAISATLIVYALCELAGCYGFLGVFVAALAIRHAHRSHAFQREMHDFTEQIERIAMMAGLLLFGGALVNGLLSPLGWREVLAAILILFAVRPIAAMIGLLGFKAHRSEKLMLAFFGIRGVGSFYYLAYGLNHMKAGDQSGLWALLSLVVLISILLHGLTVTPAMRSLDRRHGRDPAADDGAHDGASRHPS